MVECWAQRHYCLQPWWGCMAHIEENQACGGVQRGTAFANAATRWCMVVGVLWSESPVISWPLLIWGYVGSTSIICFPLPFPLSGSDSESEHAYDLEAFNSATSDCLAWHSLVLWVELLWNSHHFPVSFFGFTVFLFSYELVGCLDLPCLGFVLCSMVWGHLSLAFDS